MNGQALLAAALRAARRDERIEPGAAGRHALLGMLIRTRTRDDPRVDTVCVQVEGAAYRMRVNSRFCRDFVQCDADALALVSHEMLHLATGHMDLPIEVHSGAARLLNVALDILVNARIVGWVVPRGTGIFARCNPPRSFPAALLVPPLDLLAAHGQGGRVGHWPAPGHPGLAAVWRGERGTQAASALEAQIRMCFGRLRVRHAPAWARLYLDGWLLAPDPEGFWTRFRALMEAELGRELPLPAELRLLGDHEILDRLAGSEDGGRQPGPGASEFFPILRPPETVPPAARRAFWEQVRRAVDEADRGQAPLLRAQPERGVVPLPGRREMLLLAHGVWPAFYRWPQPQLGDEAAGVHVYLDASGSCDELLPQFLGLATALGRRLALPAWSWSTGEPLPVSRRDLQEGRLATTGGTDLEPALRHAMRHGFRRLVVLTDGYVDISEALADDARRGRLDITLLVPAWTRGQYLEHLEQLPGRVMSLPEG